MLKLCILIMLFTLLIACVECRFKLKFTYEETTNSRSKGNSSKETTEQIITIHHDSYDEWIRVRNGWPELRYQSGHSKLKTVDLNKKIRSIEYTQSKLLSTSVLSIYDTKSPILAPKLVPTVYFRPCAQSESQSSSGKQQTIWEILNMHPTMCTISGEFVPNNPPSTEKQLQHYVKVSPVQDTWENSPVLRLPDPVCFLASGYATVKFIFKLPGVAAQEFLLEPVSTGENNNIIIIGEIPWWYGDYHTLDTSNEKAGPVTLSIHRSQEKENTNVTDFALKILYNVQQDEATTSTSKGKKKESSESKESNRESYIPVNGRRMDEYILKRGVCKAEFRYLWNDDVVAINSTNIFSIHYSNTNDDSEEHEFEYAFTKDRQIVSLPEQKVVYYRFKEDPPMLNEHPEKYVIMGYYEPKDIIQDGRKQNYYVQFQAIWDHFDNTLVFRLPHPELLNSNAYSRVVLIHNGVVQNRFDLVDAQVAVSIFSESLWWNGIFRIEENGVIIKLESTVPSSKPNLRFNTKHPVNGLPKRILMDFLLDPQTKNLGLGFLEADEIELFYENFFLTHVIIMSYSDVVMELKRHYCPSKLQVKDTNGDISGSSSKVPDQDRPGARVCVLKFINRWFATTGENIFLDAKANEFFLAIAADISNNASAIDPEETKFMTVLMKRRGMYTEDTKQHLYPNSIYEYPSEVVDFKDIRRAIKPSDTFQVSIYRFDGQELLPPFQQNYELSTTAATLKEDAGKHFKVVGADCIMAELKSDGVLRGDSSCNDNDLGFPSNLFTVYGRLFLYPRGDVNQQQSHLDALKVWAESFPQQNYKLSADQIKKRVDIFKFTDEVLALYLSDMDRILFDGIPIHELVVRTCGRHKFGYITANLDLFVRGSEMVKYWVLTEILLAEDLDRRVDIILKFNRIAEICLRKYNNYNAFLTIHIALGNGYVTRLSKTCAMVAQKKAKAESLLKKSKIVVEEDISISELINEENNFAVYRNYPKKSPCILCMSLALKDLTFINDGNPVEDDFINIYKMNLMGQVIGQVVQAREKSMGRMIPPLESMTQDDQIVSQYLRNLAVIDDEKVLRQMSADLLALEEAIQESSFLGNSFLQLTSIRNKLTNSNDATTPLTPRKSLLVTGSSLHTSGPLLVTKNGDGEKRKIAVSAQLPTSSTSPR